ncbi:MAG: pyridoxal phosphate-dependent aminotransferase [Burkholderiaceae bacterium]
MSPPHAPTLAGRTEKIAPFYVMELAKKAEALQAAGAPVIHLSIGEPDFTAPPAVVQAVSDAARAGRTQYTPAMGIMPLREAIAEFYRSHWQINISPERIMVTAGASGALSLACCALVNAGDGVLLSDPGYPCNKHFVAAYDGEPQMVTCDAKSGFQLSDKLIREHWQANTRGILVSTPSNPTGTSVTTAEMGKILDTVRERGGFSIVDEIYLGLTYGSEPPQSALSHGDDMIITNSFSKYFNMTGWRLGWLVIPEPLVPGFEKLAQNLYICASALAQRAALACFEPDSLAIYHERHTAFRERRDYIVAALRKIGLTIPAEPDGAFYIYADISKFSDDSAAFALDILEKTHIALVPGMDFGTSDPARYVRISYATSMDNLKLAVDRLDKYLNN